MSTLDGSQSEEYRTPVRLCCYVAADELGGMEASLAAVVAGLDPSFEVTVMGVSALVLEEVTRGRPSAKVRLLPPVKNKLDLRSILAHVLALRDLRPDLVFASLGQLYSAQYGLMAALVNRVPAVAVVHCVLPPASRSQKVLFDLIFRRVRSIGGVSRSVCAQTEEALGLPAHATTLLYNGIADPGPGPAAGEPARRPEGFVVGAVGRLVEEKGFDTLIRAVDRLPGAHLVLVGDGPERGSLAGLAEQLGVADRVSFVGWVPAPWTGEWRFDVLAVPSRVEGFGLVAVEGQLAEIPVVASDVGGLGEILRDGENGLLVPTGDADALAVAIGRLRDDPGLRARLGRQGRSDALDRFTMAQMIRAYEEFLRPTHAQVALQPEPVDPAA